MDDEKAVEYILDEAMNKLDETGKREGNFFLRLWRGHAGLATSYWVFGVLGGFFWGIAFNMFDSPNARIGTYFLLAGMCGYYTVVYVGIWRAAERYAGKKIWAVLAKCAVVFSVFFLIRNFFYPTAY